MTESLRQVKQESLITGWDFSTSGVKCLAFDLDGRTVADVRLPTDLWTEGGVCELNIMQLEGQVRASVRAMADQLRVLGRLEQWAAGGVSATHHTSGRVDGHHNQVRRAICWNDQTLADYHATGLERLGGQKRVRELIGAPWAIRYSLSHLLKDETHLPPRDWERTERILGHGPLACGYLTGMFNAASVSAAASTGIMDLRTARWSRPMLDALEKPEYREMAWNQLPSIVDYLEPLGPLTESLAMEAGLNFHKNPLLFPNSDDQQAGLVGGGAVDAGHVAIILGTSAVVNSSSDRLPATDDLDVMRLSWGPYLWMRCYNNGAQFVHKVVGRNPDWALLEEQARVCPPGSDGAILIPFLFPEPSLGVKKERFEWSAREPDAPGLRLRAALESLAYLIAQGIRAHEQAGQKITRITVSGGMARNGLLCEILASVLKRPLQLLESDEGPALGAAVTALAGLENHFRRFRGDAGTLFTVADAVSRMVRFRGAMHPNAQWQGVYEKGLRAFEDLAGLSESGK